MDGTYATKCYRMTREDNLRARLRSEFLVAFSDRLGSHWNAFKLLVAEDPLRRLQKKRPNNFSLLKSRLVAKKG